MTQTEIGIASIQLAEKSATLAGSLRNREQITIETVPDTLDQMQFMREREVTIRISASIPECSGRSAAHKRKRSLWRG
jgi:hypothetical protein